MAQFQPPGVRKAARPGFTMIEMLTVCAIIGILVAIAIASVTKARIQAREAKAIAMVKSFANAYTTFHAREGEYPHWGHGRGSTSCERTAGCSW